jgi:hypothetical protein
MLRYRVLLVDTEANHQRPVQAYFNDLRLADQWAQAALKNAHEHAAVVFYMVTEHELGVLKKDDDTSAIPGLQPAGKEADQS